MPYGNSSSDSSNQNAAMKGAVTQMKGIMGQVTAFLGTGSEEDPSLAASASDAVNAALPEIAAAAANAAATKSFASSKGDMNAGQLVVMEAYVEPAMEAAIEEDPLGLTADGLSEQCYMSHYTVEKDLYETVDLAAAAAAKAAEMAIKAAEALDAATESENSDPGAQAAE